MRAALSEKPFVERRFDNAGVVVICRFFTPTLQPGGEYQCRWSIDWGVGEKRRHSHGLDSVQALLLALQVAHTELVESEAYKAGGLTYLEEADLGLPQPFTFPDPNVGP